MSAKMIQSSSVLLSQCDNTARMSIPSIFAQFMDMATQHADELHVSSKELGDDMFWIITRTKVHIARRPEISEPITLATWPQTPVRIRSNRCYTISDNDGVIISGKTEWTVLELSSGKLQRLSDIFPGGTQFCDDACIEEAYARVSADFDDAESIGEYTITSNDIDMVGHMNNSAYIRALCSMFTTKELSDNEITDIDIAYKAQSYEGETLTVKAKDTEVDGVTDYAMIKPDGTIAVTVRIVRR